MCSWENLSDEQLREYLLSTAKNVYVVTSPFEVGRDLESNCCAEDATGSGTAIRAGRSDPCKCPLHRDHLPKAVHSNRQLPIEPQYKEADPAWSRLRTSVKSRYCNLKLKLTYRRDCRFLRRPTLVRLEDLNRLFFL